MYLTQGCAKLFWIELDILMVTFHPARLFLLLALYISTYGLIGAQTKEDLKVLLTAKKVLIQADGKEILQEADRAKPGDIIEYTATYINQSKGPIRKLEPNLPVPEGMEYIPDSAKPKPAKASLDGKNFESIPIKSKAKGPDGQMAEKEVPPTKYKALRWYLPELARGEQAIVSARVRVGITTSPNR